MKTIEISPDILYNEPIKKVKTIDNVALHIWSGDICSKQVEMEEADEALQDLILHENYSH